MAYLLVMQPTYGEAVTDINVVALPRYARDLVLSQRHNGPVARKGDFLLLLTISCARLGMRSARKPCNSSVAV